jgi:hypothetical protein
MQNCIVFRTGNKQQVYECRYALLNYLAIYNLTPPATTGFIIHTNDPAPFDSFLPFFHSFQIKEVETVSKIELIKSIWNDGAENVIIQETDTYPIQPMEPVFDQIKNDSYYLLKYPHAGEKQTSGSPVETAVIGLHKSHADLFNEQDDLANPKMHSYEWQYWKHYHYSPAFKSLLQYFFQRNEEESIPNLVKLIHFLNADQLEQERLDFELQPLYKKWLDKLRGKGWSLERYKKKF